MQGRLLKRHSHFYYVEADGVVYECMGRGLLKKGGEEPLVGDFVELDSMDAVNRTARIHAILPRRNTLGRPRIANADGVLVVCSLKEPNFDPLQTDRYLTHVELAGLTPVLCVTKADLADNPAELEGIAALYGDRLGYRVVFTSTRRPETLDALRDCLQGRVMVLAGPSGSGKSSLLNALNPALRLRVGDISGKIGRGTHTTRHVSLLSLSPDDPDTLIADTPGFSNLRFDTILPARIESVYRDFVPLRSGCAFSDCLHINEEDCAVRAHLAQSGQAVQDGDAIAESRYTGYLALIAEAREAEEALKTAGQKDEPGYKVLHRKGREALHILRLKEKNRDAARNTRKQQVNRLMQLEEADLEGVEVTEEDAGTEAELVDDTADPV
jgi:ribosome biogenesis GTPase